LTKKNSCSIIKGEDVEKINIALEKGKRVEIIPIKDGVKIIEIMRRTIK